MESAHAIAVLYPIFESPFLSAIESVLQDSSEYPRAGNLRPMTCGNLKKNGPDGHYSRKVTNMSNPQVTFTATVFPTVSAATTAMMLRSRLQRWGILSRHYFCHKPVAVLRILQRLNSASERDTRNQGLGFAEKTVREWVKVKFGAFLDLR